MLCLVLQYNAVQWKCKYKWKCKCKCKCKCKRNVINPSSSPDTSRHKSLNPGMADAMKSGRFSFGIFWWELCSSIHSYTHVSMYVYIPWKSVASLHALGTHPAQPHCRDSYSYTCIYIYIHMNIRIYISMHKHMYIHSCMRICICMCMNIHIFEHKYTHTHTHTHYSAILLRLTSLTDWIRCTQADDTIPSIWQDPPCPLSNYDIKYFANFAYVCYVLALCTFNTILRVIRRLVVGGDLWWSHCNHIETTLKSHWNHIEITLK